MAGADLLVSHFFLENEHFLKWRDRLRREGVEIPIIPGLLLPSSPDALFRMAKLCGVSIPLPLRKNLERLAGDPNTLKEIGWLHLAKQTEALIGEGIEGVHLYALNRLETIRRFSELIQPSLSFQETYPENLTRPSLAEKTEMPLTTWSRT